MEVNFNTVVQKEMIILNEEIKTRESAIKLLINQAKKLELIKDKNLLMESVLEREAQISTAIGFDIAMPHGKSETVVQPFIGFLQTTAPFKWVEEEEEEVSMIFLIAVPDKDSDNMHLKFISNLSKKLLDEDYRNSLKETRDSQKAYDLLTKVSE